MNHTPKEKPDLSQVKYIIMDHDGTLTDGKIHTLPDGKECYSYASIDGKGIQVSKRNGYIPVIATGQIGTAIDHRAKKLEIKTLQGCVNKVKRITRYLLNVRGDWSEVAFIGNDINDTGAIKRAHLGGAVADAMKEVKIEADWVGRRCGGSGAVREFIDHIINGSS